MLANDDTKEPEEKGLTTVADKLRNGDEGVVALRSKMVAIRWSWSA